MGALKERNFRLLFFGQAASALGNTLVPVATAFAVLKLTRSAADLGIVLGSYSLAMVLVILPAGVLADRVSRRTVMMAADSAHAVAQGTLGILLITGHPAIATLAVLSACSGGASAVFTPASTGLVPSLVQPEHLQQANALQQTATSAAGIAGPALAGLLVVTSGAGWALLGDAATFVVSVVTLSLMHLDTLNRPERRRFLVEIREGWDDFWSRRWFRTIVLGASIFNFVYAGYVVLGPVASERHYHGAAAWATVATADAVGAVLAGLGTGRIHVRRPLRLALFCIALVGLSPLGFAFEFPIAALVVTGAIGGAGTIVFLSIWQTSMQRHIPEDRLSRLSAYDWFGSLIAFPVGLGVAGPLADEVGLSTMLFAIGGILIVLTLVTAFAPSIASIVDDPAA